MSDLSQYYENYLNHNGYKLKDQGETSRVAYLKEYVRAKTPVGGKVLDIGCGDMHLSELMPEFNWSGIDINVEQSNGKGTKHDLESTPYPFEGHAFDTVVCSEVLEHLFSPLKVTEEIKRLIKPGGCYILSTPNFDYVDHYLQQFQQIKNDLSKPWTYEHIRQYSYSSHEQILDAAGFELTDVVGADAQYSKFLGQGREPLRKFIELATGFPDSFYTRTDQLIGKMFPLHNHTIIIVSKA